MEPSTPAEAAEALRAAAVAGQRVRIAGNGTKLGWGNPIAPPDVELRTTGLARIVDPDQAAVSGKGVEYVGHGILSFKSCCCGNSNASRVPGVPDEDETSCQPPPTCY